MLGWERAMGLRIGKGTASGVRLYIYVIRVIDPRIMFGIISRSPPRLVQFQSQARCIAYAVGRSSNGELPVYTDIRSGKTRYLVVVKNVSGDANALRNDLLTSLFPRGSQEQSQLSISISPAKHLILSGGKWKHAVADWLKRNGF